MADPLTILSNDFTNQESAYWEKQFQRAKDARSSFERDWYMNMAFYFGRQYVSWTPAVVGNLNMQRLIEPPAPRYRVRLVANKVMPAVRKEFVKLTKEEPQFFVQPESTEPSDVASARVGESLFEYCLEEYNFNAARRMATWWMLICGTSFIRTSIDDESKNLDYLPVTAFHLFVPNLTEQTIQKQPFVMHCRAVDQEQVRKQFNITKLKPSVSTDNGTQVESVLKTTQGINNSKDNAEKQCYLKEIWIRPGVSVKYPQGAFITSVDGEIMDINVSSEGQVNSEPGLSSGEVNDHDQEDASDYADPKDTKVAPFPYDHGKYPFQKLDHVPTGRFYADSSIKYLIPLQKEYNRTRSQIIESKNRMGKPQMTYQKGSIDPNKITSEPGLMIPVMPGFDPPKPLENAEISNYVIQELDRTRADMDDIVQYEGAKNATPPGVEAASAIAYLQEENDSNLYPAVASIEDAVSESGKQTLSLVAEFWDPERIVEVVSKNNTMEAYQFVNSSAISATGTDLRVETGSMAPKSQAARQAFITELMKLGLLPPEKGLRYLQLNETNRLYDEMQAANRMAQRENFKISQGLIEPTPPPVDPMTGQPQVDPNTGQPMMGQPAHLPINSWDQDDVHIYEHRLWMNSQEFEMLDPELKSIAENHYLDHVIRASGQMMAQQGEQNAGPGVQPGLSGPQSGPGNPEPGSPPA